MRLLSLLLPIFLISIPSVTPSLFSRLHSTIHRFHSLQTNNDTTTNTTQNDILAFQYALTLERLNYAFYTQFQQILNDSWSDEQEDVYQQLEVIKEHEETHIDTIELALINLGATPVPACNYNFSLVNNTLDYITTAALLKNTGVFAYAGAINSFSDPILQQLAVTITTVEARHAAYLNYINGDTPFPFAFDLALRPQDAVSNIISLGIIESCPFELPSIYPIPNPEGSALSIGTPNTTLPNSTTYGPYTSTQAQSDLTTLQLLYQFSNLLMAYHAHGNYTNSSQWDSYKNNSETYYTRLVNQNIEHSVALASVIIARNNATLPDPCTYNFITSNTTNSTNTTDSSNTTNSSLSSFLTKLDSLQTKILYAYDGIINQIYDLELQTFITTIATVHSRHTAWIRELIDMNPFEQALDNATMPEEAISQIEDTGYIVSCPQELVPPPPRGGAAPTSEPTSEPTTSAPTSNTTSAPTSNTTSEPTDEPTIPPGPNPTNPPYPGPNDNDDTPMCPAFNFTYAIIDGIVYFNTTTDKDISYVDVHITVTNQFLNYRMNQASSNGSNDTKVYTYELPDFAYGDVQYWFTYVTSDKEGILRGCDSETFETDVPPPPGGAGTNPPGQCPAIEFDSYINGTTIYFNVTSSTNTSLEFVDVHATHNITQYNYRMIENGTIYSLTLPEFIDFSENTSIEFYFTYSTGEFQCDTDVYTGNVTLTPPTNATTSPPTGTTSPPTGTTSPPTGTTSPPTGTTTAPTTDAPTTSAPTTSAPTSGNETTSTPTPTLDPALVDFVPPGDN